MQYPVLNGNSKAINLASKDSYSCLYDIVWSFDYAISGNSSTEAGFTVFLTTSTNSLSGGNSGIDCGYSGVSSLGLPYTVKPGVSGAVIGIAFDTTGLFAASATSGSFTRDGIDYTKVEKNSITLRGGAPYYNYSDYSYNTSISSLNSTFTIVESAVKFKTIRARLGNLGRTIYIDYRNNANEDYQRILEKDVSLGLPITAFLNAGVSFVTPISSSNVNSIGNIFLKNFHVEGSTTPNLTRSIIYDPTTSFDFTAREAVTIRGSQIVVEPIVCPEPPPVPVKPTKPPTPPPTPPTPPKGIVTIAIEDQIDTFSNDSIFPFDD